MRFLEHMFMNNGWTSTRCCLGHDVVVNQAIDPIGKIMLRPDIIDVTAGEIYEIKLASVYGLATGWTQLFAYISILNFIHYEGRSDYHYGTSYDPFGWRKLNKDPGYSYFMLGNTAGVLFYQILEPPPTPIFLPAPEPALQEAADRVGKFFKNLADDMYSYFDQWSRWVYMTTVAHQIILNYLIFTAIGVAALIVAVNLLPILYELAPYILPAAAGVA